MFRHTEAFASYRNLSQAHLDFVVVVCHAMPTLRADVALPNPALTFRPDYFYAAQNPKSWVASRTSTYQDELARSTLITIFSYFEAYVKDAIIEMVNFHGGKERFQTLSRTRSNRFIQSPTATILKHKRKLQDRPQKVKLARYQKFGRILEKDGFLFPSDLLSNFGAKYLIEKLHERKGMRAWEIPVVLGDALLFVVSDKDRKLFEDVRKVRNKIAHGKPHRLALKTALRYSSELHAFAAKIDKHLLEHFFVIQAT